jgi:hypothetical protein
LTLSFDTTVEDVWYRLNAALHCQSSDKEERIIDRESNAAIADIVWRQFLGDDSSVEVCKCHVKCALVGFDEVPEFVIKFLAGAPLPMKEREVPHVVLREVISIQIKEFYASRNE